MIAIGACVLGGCIYLGRRHQVEDFKTWLLVEGIPVVVVATILLSMVWLVLKRL